MVLISIVFIARIESIGRGMSCILCSGRMNDSF